MTYNSKILVLHPNQPTKLSPQEVVEVLREGNQRYTRRERAVRSLQSSLGRKQLAEQGQNPIAMVLTCADSRITAEGIFDCGFGDLFVVRNLGGAVDAAGVASLEYGHKKLNIPLLLILGHTGCSAIRSALEVYQGKPAEHLPHHATQLAARLQTSLDHLTVSDPSLRQPSLSRKKWDSLFEKTLIENLDVAAREIFRLSPFLKQATASGKLGVVMGLFDLCSGRVECSSLLDASTLGPESLEDVAA
jgi:carbonic anhydrase